MQLAERNDTTERLSLSLCYIRLHTHIQTLWFENAYIKLTANTVISSIQSFSHVWLFVTPWTAACQASCPSPTLGACSNSCPLNLWCHPTISSSVMLFSSHLQSFSASGSFQMSQFFTSGGQSIGASASASVLPMNIQDWSPLGWTGWISLQSKGLSRVPSNTTVQKHSSLALSFFYSPILTSRHGYWKNHSFD